jgi:1-hydroxycarotenoid 3,4-desaturase
MKPVLIIGAGLGGLAAAVELAAQGVPVQIFEREARPGGKAGQVELDGVFVDTGPSVMTLPEVLEGVLQTAGVALADVLTLREASPGFRYHYPDGVVLDVHHAPADTIESVRQTLGAGAARELESFLAYAGSIWQAAAADWVFGPAPTVLGLVSLGLRKLATVRQVDPLRTMDQAIHGHVRDPHLVDLLRRYATYNGSDPRRAPATLNCIAHVELALGGYGVEGGIFAVVQALVDQALRHGAELHLGCGVQEIELDGGRFRALRLDDGRRVEGRAVVCNADAAHLAQALLPAGTAHGIRAEATPSMSGWTGIVRARRRTGGDARVPHQVFFPRTYAAEFTDIFDRDLPPREPTVYVCAQEPCHGRPGWDEDEPLFTMVNTPPLLPGRPPPTVDPEAVRARLVEVGALAPEDRVVWSRQPAELARTYPHTGGAIYGAASNSPFAAFQRPPNALKSVPGVFLATGSAHPGGGMPLALHSGRLAARGVLAGGAAP